MKEDIFDVVDLTDNVVCQLPRSEVHAKGLMHRASHVLIFADSEKGRKILLQKRSAFKDTFPNCYTTSCSGHVDAGEDYDTAVVREMFEETGLRVELSQLRKIGKISPCKATGQEFTFVYEMLVPESTSFSANPEEVSAFEWILETDFNQQILQNPEKFTPSFIKVYNFYLSERKK